MKDNYRFFMRFLTNETENGTYVCDMEGNKIRKWNQNCDYFPNLLCSE